MKRGIASLIATVLMILITIAAVGVIAQVVVPLVKDNLQTAGTCSNAKLSVDTEYGYSVYDLNNNVLSVSLTRGAEEMNLAGFQLKLTSTNGQSKIAEVREGGSYGFISSAEMPERNSVKVYLVNASALNISNINKVGVAPIIQVGKTSTVCGIESGLVEIPESSAQINFSEGYGGSPQQTPPNVWEGLSFYWNFNENSGNTAVDQINGVNGMARCSYGGASVSPWSPGKIGNALNMTTDPGGFCSPVWMEIPIGSNPQWFSWANGGTLSFWVIPTSTTGTSSVFSKTYGVSIRLNNGIFETNRFEQTTEYWYSSTTTIVPGNWYFVTVTSNSTEGKIFINGNEEGTMGYSMPSSSAPAITDGLVMDEMMAWNRTLSLSEIQYIYNSGAGRSYP